MHIITADEAAALVRSGDTVVIGGSGAGHAVPEALMAALGRRFATSGEPRGITALHPVGLGDARTRGAGHFAQPGMLKRVISGTYVDSPGISRISCDSKPCGKV